MSNEGIVKIRETEEASRRRKAEAVREAKRLAAEAETAGQEAVEEACHKAAEELAALDAKADEKAKADARELAANMENKKASLRVKAESRLTQAADLIVERIVKS